MDISREEVVDPARTATRPELEAGRLSEAELVSLSILKVSSFYCYQSSQHVCLVIFWTGQQIQIFSGKYAMW